MKNKKRNLAIIFSVFCFFGIIITSVLMMNWKTNTNANKLVQKKTEEYIEVDKQQNRISINFEELRKMNSDTIGYIEIPNTNINYVVVKGKDNSYYLTHNFNKEYNVAGWIFMDYKNTADGTDKNIVIYGHDVADESMFGSLSKLLDEKSLENNENRIISFITEKEIKKYQIFSIYTIKPEKYYITTEFKEQEFIKFKEKVKERSRFKLEADLDNKNILTLSTCQNYGAKRLAVHAVEI